MSDRFDLWLATGLRQLEAAVPVAAPGSRPHPQLAPVRVVRSGSRALLPLGLIAGLVVVVALSAFVSRSPSAGPGAASPSTVGTPLPTASPTVTASLTNPADVLRDFGDLSFVAPANWGILIPHVWTAPIGPRLFLSDAPIADPCPTDFRGIQCWLPLTELPPDGILVTFGGSAILTLPNPTPVPIARSADGQCAQIGGERQYAVALQGFAVDACLRGPDFDTNAAAFSRLVSSIRRASLEPSPSPSALSTPSATALDISGAGLFGTEGIWADANGQLLSSDHRGTNWQALGPWGLSSFVLDANHAWTVTAGPGSTEQNGSSSDVLHLVVSRTDDGGRTWTAASVAGSYPETFDQVRFLGPLTGYLLASAQRQSDGVGTVFRTVDGGATWHVMSTLMWPGSTVGIASDGTIWIGANAEAGPVAHPLLMSSRDGGKTWSKAVLPGLEGRTGGADLYVPEPPVFWSPSEGVVEVADSAGPVRLYRSHDGGRTWTLAAERPTGGEGGGTEGGAFVSPTDWLLAEPEGSSQVLVRSTNGGVSWITATTMSANPAVTGILELQFWDASNGIAVEGTTSALLITADGGATWSQVDGP